MIPVDAALRVMVWVCESVPIVNPVVLDPKEIPVPLLLTLILELELLILIPGLALPQLILKFPDPPMLIPVLLALTPEPKEAPEYIEPHSAPGFPPPPAAVPQT